MKLNQAMKLGKLGEQIVLKSKKSFENIAFVQAHESVKEIYYPKKVNRDSAARSDYQIIQSSNRADQKEALYLMDLLRQGEGAYDARLQRALS